MRQLFTGEGLTQGDLRWGERTGRWRRANRGVWAEGPEEPTELDRARAAVMPPGGWPATTTWRGAARLDAVGLHGIRVTAPRTASGRRERWETAVVAATGQRADG